MQQQEHKRRFSLEEDFMKSRINAQLFGFMRCLSTAMPKGDKWEEYLLKSTFNKSKKILMDVCGIGTTKTLKRHIDSLIEAGLVEEGVMRSNGKEYPCYYFPFDYDGNYKLIEKDLVRYLVETRSSIAIKVYLYLLNCSTAKKDYEFTITEISKALGYAPSSQSPEATIRNCLQSLKREGIINYVDTYKQKKDDTTDKIIPVPIKILKFVVVSKNQLLAT